MQTSQAQRRRSGLERIRSVRGWQAGAMVGGLALIGMAVGGVGLGAAGGGPSMQVLPSPNGVKYSQTVEVKAQNLPKGSGSTAATICGLNDASGKKIATPTADDCAGANDLSSGLVKLQQWNGGSFDVQYTLPKSGQKFGKNQHFCDATHLCALVVADANPSAPAYYITTQLQFVDQKSTTPTTAKKPTTTKPGTKPKPTTPAPAPTTTSSTTTTTAPLLAVSAGGGATAGQNGGSGSGNVSVAVNVPAGGAQPTLPSLPGAGSTPTLPTLPPQAADAINQACAQLASAAQQGGVDTTALTTACSTVVNGGGGAELAAILQSPSLGCFAASSLTQNNAQLADACSQLATALQPYSNQLGTALAPVLALLP
jgi:hypothetical protein